MSSGVKTLSSSPNAINLSTFGNLLLSSNIVFAYGDLKYDRKAIVYANEGKLAHPRFFY